MRVLVYLIGIIPLCFVLSVGATTVAQDDNEEQAKAAFYKAKDLFHSKKFKEAADTFREANRLKFSWKLLYNIGQADAAAKRYGLALEAFEHYLGEGGDEVKSQRQEEVRAEIKRLKGMIGFLSITGPGGSIVLIDDVDRGTVPLPGRVQISAGVVHHLVIRLGNDVLVDRTIRLSSGEAASIEAKKPEQPGIPPEVTIVENEPSPDVTNDSEAEPEPAANTPNQMDTETNSKLRPIGWSLLGVGAATAIVGVIAGASSMSKEGELESNCEGTICSEDERDTYESAQNLAAASNILIPAGAALAVTGLVLAIVGGKKEKENSKASVALQPGPFSLSITGRF